MNVARPFSSLAAATLPPPEDKARRPNVEALFSEYEQQVFGRTNRFFAWLLPLQWAGSMVYAAIWSPRTWAGMDSSIHPHLLAAVFLGALLTLPPLWLMRTMPYTLATRQVVAIAQMGFSALLIDITGGRIETHFHVFGSLAFLALYRDWRVLPMATIVVGADHVIRGIWLPESVYGVPYASVWRTAEHVWWVAFEDVVLAWACLVSRREMWEICLRQDQNEELLGQLEERVRDRTRDLEAEVRHHERTSQELGRSEHRYRQLIANIPIGIVETTRGGGVRLANPHIRALLQLPPEMNAETLDLSDGRIFPTAERTRFWSLLTEGKEVRGFETTLFRTDGTPVPVVVNARLRTCSESPAPVCEATIEDISERRRAAAELEKLNQQLITASRAAGQADVATGVLHNVGNVLTSVNLIITDVQDRVKATRLAHLRRVVGVLAREKHRLGEFLTQDPAGRSLPDFLAKLDAHLAEESRQIGEDVRTLVGHFEHIREIIQSQQSSARRLGLTETVAPADLMDDALSLNIESFTRHSIAVVKTYEPAPKVRVDRHKVVQVLVNLLKNAKDAVLTLESTPRTIVAAVRTHSGAVELIVRDTGSGIAAENLAKIFQHGFTTKRNGHGFGLHSCALAAQEIGGSLTAASDGPGRGAAFTLTLPLAASQPA